MLHNVKESGKFGGRNLRVALEGLDVGKALQNL
jgi:hypothetical protein